MREATRRLADHQRQMLLKQQLTHASTQQGDISSLLEKAQAQSRKQSALLQERLVQAEAKHREEVWLAGDRVDLAPVRARLM